MAFLPYLEFRLARDVPPHLLHRPFLRNNPTGSMNSKKIIADKNPLRDFAPSGIPI
jgi:hypothetical protein